MLFSLQHSVAVIQFASAPQSRVKCATEEDENKEIMGLGQVLTVLIVGLKGLESSEFLFLTKTVITFVGALVEVGCQISDSSWASS